MDSSDLNIFVTGLLRGDQSLFKRKESASSLLDQLKQYSGSGEWEWKEKGHPGGAECPMFYDGTPLTRWAGRYSGVRIREQFRIDAAAGGSDGRGTSVNTIEKYAIYNGLGEDVTSHFTNVEKVWEARSHGGSRAAHDLDGQQRLPGIMTESR